MALNIITAKFCSGSTQTWTDEAWQYDYGQVLQFDGLTLPDAYEVHFSNTPMSGETITQIGGADGVTVPDQFFTGGETIYAWVYLHEGEDDGETVYMVTIPVKKRPQPSDDIPTPEEQSAIDQAIAALNVAVEKAEDAIEHYPTIIDGTWHVWDVTTETWIDTEVQAQGRDGEDGFSPEITVQDITNGHRVTITDAGGTHTFDVMDGEPGEPGATGNGIASIAKTGTSGLVDTYTITYTNGQTTTFTVTNGSDATVTVDDELSTTSENPVQNKVITEAMNDVNEDLSELSSSIAPVESSATATAAHAVGELFMMGETLMVALSAIAIGDTITTEGGSPNAAVTTLSSKLLKDVQVNGTSVVSQGVANIPKASYGNLGAVFVEGDGLEIVSTGRMRIRPASDAKVKSGTEVFDPIVPYRQHASTFYGLAKAAGSDEKNSSLAVGTYTDAAKVAIQKMLGIYEPPWELLNDITLDAIGGIDLTADSNGTPYNLRSVFIQILYPANSETIASGYSRFRVQDANGNSIGAETSRYQTATSVKYKLLFFERKANMLIAKYQTQALVGGAESWRTKNASNDSGLGVATGGGVSIAVGNITRIFEVSDDTEPAGTKIRIYGQRAY